MEEHTKLDQILAAIEGLRQGVAESQKFRTGRPGSILDMEGSNGRTSSAYRNGRKTA